MCFIGHGAFGIITKTVWLSYFAAFGIGSVMGYHIMAWLGTFDILLGVSLLLFPTRAVFILARHLGHRYGDAATIVR